MVAMVSGAQNVVYGLKAALQQKCLCIKYKPPKNLIIVLSGILNLSKIRIRMISNNFWSVSWPDFMIMMKKVTVSLCCYKDSFFFFHTGILNAQ